MAEVYELLINCASQGDISQLDSVLTNHKDVIDINFQTEGGLNLLMHAVISAGSNVYPKGQHLDVVKVLTRAGISLAVADVTYGRTALHWAVHYDREDILTELLLTDSENVYTIPDFSGLSPFHLAIQGNSIKCLEIFLAYLPPEILEYPDTQGRRPLTLSIIEGNLEAFVLLLNAGVNLKETDISPLQLSSQCGQIEMLELLIKTGQVDIAETNNDGQTVAHISATQLSPEMLQVVARYRVELLQSPDTRGITPLMYACGYGIDTSVKFLIKKKVPLDSIDNEGKSCIHWASESQADKASKCIQLLCRALPSLIELTDQQGRTPFHISAMSGNSKNMDMLINLGCNVQVTDANQCTALHWAAASGQLECMATSVKLGIPVDVPNKQGMLPIHFAANSGNEHCLKYLLDAGCEIESKDGNQRTPVHWAVQDSGSIKCLQTLVMHGANFNEIDASGLNALHMACRSDNLLACQYLIETARCDGNAVDAEGQTALFHALESGSLGCMEFLLSRGSSCNHQNNEGRSLAHLAASVGSVEALQLLIQYGADFELYTPTGIRPIHDAAANGQADALEYLASIGCDIFAQTLDGSTILHYSAVQGHSVCVKMILDSSFDPNVILTTEEGDKLTPLDCAEAYGHTETAALIKSAGGQHYASFVVAGDENTATVESKALQDTEAFTDEKLFINQQKLPPDAQANQISADINDVPIEVGNFKSEKEVDPKTSEDVNNKLLDGPVENIDNKVTSQLADVTTAELETVKDQASETKAVQEQNSLIGQSSAYETDNKVSGSRPSTKAKSGGSLFAKAISFLKREDKKPSIVSSSVALCGAQATILAGAIIGSPLGRKAMEVGEKVAKNAAEELKEEASRLPHTLPALLWDESTSPTPLPTPTPPATPSPEPVKAPSPVVVNIDPYEKRIRKARAQLDEKKTPAFLAIQELLKAEETHLKLTKQFEFATLEEHLEVTRSEYRTNEAKAEQETQALLEKQKQKIEKIQAASEAINTKIDKVLETATNQNIMLNVTLKTLGIPPNPTVSEWIKRKEEERKAKLQSKLILWDIHKSKREQAIKMRQLLTSERATRHAAWETEKNIQRKIKHMKDRKVDKVKNPNAHNTSSSPSSIGNVKNYSRRLTGSSDSKKDKNLRSNSMRNVYSVHLTPTGFKKVNNSPTPCKTNQLWMLGSNVAKGNLSSTKVLLDEAPLPVRIRATGPKSYHVGRTLIFVPPEEYKRSEKDPLLQKTQSFEQGIILQKNYTAQYHSHTRDVIAE